MRLHLSRLNRVVAFLLLCSGVAIGVGCAHPQNSLPSDGSLRESEGTPEKSISSSREYVLQDGDEIDIQVYREPDLSGAFRLKPSGKIRHPLVGSVGLGGKTVKEAEVYFTKRLAKDYLVNPRVIIKILSTKSSQIILMGEVENPGVYPLPFDGGMTFLQAIAGAGGFTDLASPDRVCIVRQTEGEKNITIRVRVSDLLRGKGKQKDIPMEPNDVIMVPEIIF